MQGEMACNHIIPVAGIHKSLLFLELEAGAGELVSALPVNDAGASWLPGASGVLIAPRSLSAHESTLAYCGGTITLISSRRRVQLWLCRCGQIRHLVRSDQNIIKKVPGLEPALCDRLLSLLILPCSYFVKVVGERGDAH